jgi:asparagine synthase (glutamine-hydrolysing)
VSVEYGLWNFEQQGPDPKQIQRVRKILSAYACDGMSDYADDEITLLHLPFHVTQESESERQPFLTDSGKTLLWDGRLDNREELIGSLRETLRDDLSDAAIAAAALESWGTRGLKQLVGDWALSVWNPAERVVLLAKDFLGARSLFYTVEENCFVWSTLIDPLLLARRRTFQLQEEYLAGWLSHFPAPHLTPFAGIHSVPPGSYVLFRAKTVTVHQYWTFDPDKRICYRNDREYEDHFRSVFGEAVRRRLRAAAPVLAELSGGMDSCSIVCTADHLMAQGSSGTPRLDTISSFDNSEPNWNEAPFFGKVEERRGRAGHHVPLEFGGYWHPLFDPNVFAGTPGFGRNLNDNAGYESCIASGRYRVLLQGTGGDEVLGGVPTPLPELADLLARGRVSFFLRQLLVWAIAQRIPALHLAGRTIQLFLPTFLGRGSASRPTWLTPQFARRNARALNGYARRFRVFGPLPGFAANQAALESLRRQIGCVGISPRFRVERRYPFFDRDLLEYLYAIPREQLVRPNQRRSLMRRALVGIVPAEILNRRRKAFLARTPLTSLQTELPPLLERSKDMNLSSAGIVNEDAFRGLLKKAAEGGPLPVVPVLRTLLLEAWLAHLASWTCDSGSLKAPARNQMVFNPCDAASSHNFFS